MRKVNGDWDKKMGSRGCVGWVSGCLGEVEGDASKLRFFLEPSFCPAPTAGTFCGHRLRLFHYFTHSSSQKARFGKMKFVSNYIFVAKAGRGQL